MLSNEQYCLWGCGNAFVVNLNHNLEEKNPICFVRYVSSLYRNQLIHSDLREEFFLLHTCLYICEEQPLKSQRWIHLLHGFLCS